MSTIDRYIARTFLKNFGLVLIALVSLYALVEFLEKIDDFIEYDAVLSAYVVYPLYNLPRMIGNSLPMSILLAAFATIGGLSRTNQLTALQGGGVSLFAISRPMFFIGLALTLFSLLGNLWLTPWSTREATYVFDTEIKGRYWIDQGYISRDLFFREGDKIVSIGRFYPQKKLIRGITVIQLDDQFLPIKRTQARKIRYQGEGLWHAEEVKIWRFTPGSRAVENYEEFDQKAIDFGRRPGEILQLWDKPEEMTAVELVELLKKMRAQEMNLATHQVELHLRLAHACTPLVMVLLGIPFARQRGRQASFSLGVITSLIIFLAYFLIDAVCTALGLASVLPPMIAAWSANVLMALVGIWMFLTTQE